MSVLLTTRRLVESHLDTIGLPIAWEAAQFNPPEDGSKYLKCTLIFDTPDDSCISESYSRYYGNFDVLVLDRLGIGVESAITTAENIREMFKKRTTFSEGNVRVQILTTPHLLGAVVAQDRLVVPVRIELTVENL